MSSGIFGIVERWLAGKRAKTQEKERIERERLEKIEAEKKAEQERRAKLEYERSFWYSSKPYCESCYDGLDCAKIRKELCSASCYRDVVAALSPFKSVQEGYAANLPWLKEWASLDLTTRTVDVLYVAFCMSDHLTCDSLVDVGYVLNKPAACSCLIKLASSDIDEHTKAFIARYIDLTPESVAYYQSNIKWFPILESRIDTVPFYTRLGLKPTIGDEGLSSVRHSDFAKWYSYDMESPLSRALDQNDLDRLAFLLKWGANPNQYLYWSCGRAPGSTPIHEMPVMNHIRSVEAFEIMTRAGMEWYPCPNPSKSSDRCNLINHLWLAEDITGTRLELLVHLYEIGYDKPLREKHDYYRGLVKNRGSAYEKNIVFIQQWLDMLDSKK